LRLGRSGIRNIFLVLFTVTLVSWSNASYIHLKAQLAQLLIEVAWQNTLNGQPKQKPWPWADTWPIAKLSSNKLGNDLLVLAGADGSSLAFGPGHMSGTMQPGEAGTSVIAGHRDTHFRFLQELEKGDSMLVQDETGSWHSFAVNAIEIIDSHNEPDWNLDLSRDELHLVTCYPFDAISPGGPLRFIVTLNRFAG
jgi:sortase A